MGQLSHLEVAGSFLLPEESAESWDTGSEEMVQHWAPRGDVADGHRATERYCREGGMSYCEDGHSWGLVVRAAGGRWIVFRPKKVLGDTEYHGGRKQCDVGARDHRCPDSGMRPHDNPATFGETQYLMYCRDR